MTGPTISRGTSRQDWATPADFMQAVVNRFAKPTWDLAGSVENKKAPNVLTEEMDSFAHDWHTLSGLLWLNPPFSSIAPWAEKCAMEAQLGANILFLVPASVGSNWFRDHVFCQSMVLFLNGRLTFEGATDPYPKDLMLCWYGTSLPGVQIWNWREWLR